MVAVKVKRGAKPKSAAKVIRRPALPSLSSAQRRGLILGASALAVAGLVIAGWVLDWPEQARQAVALNSAAAGFEIRHVEVLGVREVPRLKVYEAVLAGPSNPMLATDLGAIRERLRAQPWVADASVSRRLPDTVIVRVSERKPVALWQYHGRFRLVDITGRVLAARQLERFASLPLVVGADANLHVGEMLQFASAAPGLAEQLEAGVLVGGRRWNLRLKTGETLALPDTPDSARKALLRFAKLEADLPAGQKLLGGRFERFDLRVPGQMTVGGPEVQKALEGAAKAARAEKQATI